MIFGIYAAPSFFCSSLVCAVLFDEAEREQAQERLAGKQLFAPRLLSDEVVNVALKKLRGGMPAEVVEHALEDYAALILGLLALYQADFNPRWYERAIHLAEDMAANFRDPAGGFFDTRSDHDQLITRPKEVQDNATPSGSALAASALLHLAAHSAWHRRGTLVLVMLSIALAAFLLLTLERLRQDLRAGFSQAVSGTDLVVGARTGPVQLMLYAVFRIGGATNNVSAASRAEIAAHRAVAWLVPLSLGDSHRGMPVMGTTPAYFERFLYGDKQPLAFAEGRAFAGTLDGLYEAVLGAEVAARLGYASGQRLTLSHGLPSGGVAGPSTEHADKPFTVVGVLARTGTPVDRTVHVSLQAIQAIHLEWAGGAPLPGLAIPAEQARKFDLEPKQVSAALLGLKSRAAVFAVQRFVGEYEREPLLAVLPGVALDELWQAVGLGERALMAMSAIVALVSLAGLVAVVLAGLNERRRELAVLRAVGAGPRHVLVLLILEGSIVTLLGALLGLAASLAGVAAAAPWVQAQFGISLRPAMPGAGQWALLGAVLLAGMLASLVPAIRAYRLSLADGLSPRS